MDKPGVQRATAWIGLLGFMIGFTSFLVIRMWFGKAVEDFNDAIIKGGQSAPALIAAASNGFVSEYFLRSSDKLFTELSICISGIRCICVLRCPTCLFVGEVACSLWQSVEASVVVEGSYQDNIAWTFGRCILPVSHDSNVAVVFSDKVAPPLSLI